MSFRDAIVREVQKVSKRCFICDHEFTKKEYKAVHSATGFHLELIELTAPVRYAYAVTDPPRKYRYMKGRVLEVDEFLFGFRYFADAVCLCNGCHQDVHSLALELCRERISGFKGNTPTPRLLAEATFKYHTHRSPIPA